MWERNRRLLAVVLQYLVAGGGNPRPVLLQAGEDREVALVDDAAAVPLNIAVAGCLLLRRAATLGLYRLLGESRRSGGDESKSQDKLAHLIFFQPRKIFPFRMMHRVAGTDSWVQAQRATFKPSTRSRSWPASRPQKTRRAPAWWPDLVLAYNRRRVLSDGGFANGILADRILANWGVLGNRLRTRQICSDR